MSGSTLGLITLNVNSARLKMDFWRIDLQTRLELLKYGRLHRIFDTKEQINQRHPRTVVLISSGIILNTLNEFFHTTQVRTLQWGVSVRFDEAQML
jgi:hypothetical protein